ncbi:MAG: Loki-CTERM sorting domain-containing protein, partial [Promethearchaeota archaeon]
IKIPKNELENYDPNEDLGIIVGGYGTMTILNTNFWVFSTYNGSIRHQQSVNYLYYDMKGLVVPPEVIPGYSLLIVIGITCIISVILIKRRYSK